MKTKKIWMMAIIFGLLATGTLYIALFYNNKGQTVSSAPNTNTTNQNVNNQPADNKKEEPENTKVDDKAEQEKKEDKEQANEFIKQELLPIEEGKRAMSISIGKLQGVQGFISAGDYIDIIALTPSKEEWNHDAEAQLSVQNVKVLGLGHATDDLEKVANYETVTVEVTPDQALRLSLTLEEGKVYLMLRGKDDTSTIQDYSHIHSDQLHLGGHLIGGHR